MTAQKPQTTATSPVLTLQRARQLHRETFQNQILSAVATMITTEGVEALSMRKLAEMLGCAPMTLYSYFKSKHELLLALAHRSFDALALRLKSNSGGPPLEALRTLYLAYGQFGLENPNDYHTVFMTPEAQPPREAKRPDQMLAENPAFAAGFQRAQASVEAGVLAGDSFAIATLLWTAVHGAVAVILTFPAFPFGKPENYLVRVIDLMIAGLNIKPADPLV